MIHIPSWAEPRVTAVLLAAPFVAGATAGVMGKKPILWLGVGTVPSPGDQFSGLPLGAISLRISRITVYRAGGDSARPGRQLWALKAGLQLDEQ